MRNNITVLTATDLHRRSVLLAELHQAVIHHQPSIVALVGDFLHAFNDNNGRVSAAECAQLISKLPVGEIVFVRGNHEDEAWWEFAQIWTSIGRPLRTLHGELFSLGPMTLIGFPCLMGDENPFSGERPSLAFDPDEWLPQVILPAGRAARTLWLMHEPPVGTPLSQRGSVVEGNQEWVQAIERFSPLLTISGHDHHTPIRSNCWHHRIGQTTCVNVGQTDNGPLHYCVIKADFESSLPSLPSRMQVTAFPWQESIAISKNQQE